MYSHTAQDRFLTLSSHVTLTRRSQYSVSNTPSLLVLSGHVLWLVRRQNIGLVLVMQATTAYTISTGHFSLDRGYIGLLWTHRISSQIPSSTPAT